MCRVEELQCNEHKDILQIVLKLCHVFIHFEFVELIIASFYNGEILQLLRSAFSRVPFQ